MRRLLALIFIASAAGAQTEIDTARVKLPNFAIDKTEVTVRAFSEYAKQNAIQTLAEREGGGFEWGFGWQRREGWSYRRPQGELAAPNEPAVHLSWDEANAYCKSTGGRLPTKAEWASAAYTEQRKEPTSGYESGLTYPYPVGIDSEGMNNNRSHHLPVATTKEGVNGLYDMGANAWEWLADRRGDEALTAGGSWWYGPEKTRIEGMQWKPASFYAVYIGFRCVY